jgi:hypothetical protein
MKATLAVDLTFLTRATDTLSSQNARVRKVKSTAKVAFIDRLLRDLDILPRDRC